jgi:(+)-trans-carveol dehydrogenase
MASLVEGKVALITGAARGQGRSHAVRLAQEGAAIIAVDVCAPVESVRYALPAPSELDDTVDMVRSAGGRIVGCVGDVRSQHDLDAAVAEGVESFGRIDIVVANAGINGEMGPAHLLSESAWQTVIDIDLSGAWRTVKAALPAMIDGGNGGSIVFISSVGGAKGHPMVAPYIAAKHGMIGLMRSLARELAPHRIRVNAILPTNVDTPMVHNDVLFELFCPDVANPTLDDVLPRLQALNSLEVPWIEAVYVSNAVVWLSSDQARYVTGVSLPVDAGALLL